MGSHGKPRTDVPSTILVVLHFSWSRDPRCSIGIQPARRQFAGHAGPKTPEALLGLSRATLLTSNREPATNSEEPVLRVEDLRTYFFIQGRVVRAVDGVTLSVNPRETFGLVGETGCGKSVMALSVMRLVDWPPGRVVGGRVVFRGRDLLQISDEEMRRVRGNNLSMIFQEPMTSLNPVFTVGDQLAEMISLHQHVSHNEAMSRAADMLKKVQIPDPERAVKKYPHELSGGMRQRAMIAMAASCNPTLMIADEPTTALDVTIEAQVLDLMKKLVQEIDASVLLITHDLGIIAENCDRVAVMYAGNIVETADVKTIFREPCHPYTQGLLNAIPSLEKKRGEPLAVIEGSVPDLAQPPSGCKFHPRCARAMRVCSERVPTLVEVKPGHLVSCFLYRP
jgi:oligopeptide/dipeptide ABC transporter ATP-binding protein